MTTFSRFFSRRFSLLFFFLAALLGAQSVDQLYIQGYQAFEDELWSAAVSSFSRLLREYPEDPRADAAAYMNAVALYRAGDHSRSLSILSSFSGDYPESSWNRRIAYWKGLILYEGGDWKGAAEAFESQIGLDVAYTPHAWFYLGASREQLGDAKGSETAYEALIEAGGDLKVRGLYRLGLVRLADQRPSEALEAFTRLALEHHGTPHGSEAPYWMAECHRLLGHEAAALEQYRIFLNSHMDSPYRSRAFLEAARLSSDADETLSYLERYSREFPGENPAVLRLRAAALLRAGRLEEAREAYKAVLDNPVSGIEAQRAAFDLAQTFLGTPEVLEALPYLERAAGGPELPLRADALYLAGILLLDAGRSDSAMGFLEPLVSDFPGDTRREEVLKLMTRHLRDAGGLEEASAFLNILIEDYGESGEASAYLFLRGEISRESGREWAALADYAELIRRYPDSIWAFEARLLTALIYTGRGEHVRAAEHYLEAAETREGEPRRRVHYSAALAYFNAGFREEALGLFDDLLSSGPAASWFMEAAYYKAEILYDLEMYSEAREFYALAAGSDDDALVFEALYGMGWTWFRQADWSKAVAAFLEASSAAPDAVKRGRALYRAGLSQASDENWNAALETYERALAIPEGPWREEALYHLSWALLSLGREGEALAVSSTLADEFPFSNLPAELPFMMGESLLESGDPQAALLWYDKCVALYPESPTALRAALRAALAAAEAGRAGEAARRYGEWISAHPHHPGAPAAARSWSEVLLSAGDLSVVSLALELVVDLPPATAAPVILSWVRVMGIPPESREILESLAENDDLSATDRAEALLLTAHRYRFDGRERRAMDIYELLVRDIPGRIGAEAQEGLARVLRDAGRLEEAAEAYLAVSYLFPEQSELALTSLSEAERLYREMDRHDEADKIRSRRETYEEAGP